MDLRNLSWDEETDLYSQICDAYERVMHEMPLPGEEGYEEMPFSLTSDEARRMASAAFKILEVRERTPQEWIDHMGVDAVKNILRYQAEKNGWDLPEELKD